MFTKKQNIPPKQNILLFCQGYLLTNSDKFSSYVCSKVSSTLSVKNTFCELQSKKNDMQF